VDAGVVVKRSLAAVFGLVAAVAVAGAGAGGCSAVLGLDDLHDRGGDGGSDASPTTDDAVGATTASKLDLLLVVDDSAAMADKAEFLAQSIGTLLTSASTLVDDIHVGVITSSLGAMGGDICGDTATSNRRAHLSRVSPQGAVVPGTDGGFLKTDNARRDLSSLVAGTALLVRGVGEQGCALEAQLESAYRFLVQPDPWSSIVVRNGIAELDGIDDELLNQRQLFLRPDSLVVVLMLTDEDDSAVDPRSFAGRGWSFENSTFPGSTTYRADGLSTTAPRATRACDASPGAPACVSCGCKSSDEACQAAKSDPSCAKTGGFYGPAEDSLNVRFSNMKRRFGVDPQFPIARYVDGFTKARVPDRTGEHSIVDGEVSGYTATRNCSNPLFAGSLPGRGGDTCALPPGVRGKELVVFALIGGVPPPLVANDPPDWTAILGADPEAYDLTGIDAHMLQSVSPREGLPTEGVDMPSDPVHGFDWYTQGNDLQYACTFPLSAARICSASDPACDCAGPTRPPLCSVSGEIRRQSRGKAYPTPRELRVVKGLGDRGLAASICPTGSGYASAVKRLAALITPKLVKP
jgi:hypothetical protein